MRGFIVLGLMALAVLASMSAFGQQRDSTPFNCEQIKGTPVSALQAATMRKLCRDLEASHVHSFAKLQGKPRPSKTVIRLPAYGSLEGTQFGLVCMGGQSMRRLSNGWEQIRDADGNWQRCEAR